MTIKQLTWRLMLPLTIISFGTLTKWWYVLPVDAPDTLMAGFPFAFVSDGWFTSMSLQLFLLEFSADFVTYFLFWFLLIFFTNRILTPFAIPKILTRILWTWAILTFSFWTLILTNSEKHIKLKRDWDMRVLVTGYKFTWKNTDRPDFSKHYPAKK